ncbi:MAG: hypothetical protein J2P47_15995 [Acetobacteraceae bacterium]|nr:hypothetical protein [Acetobacteraceae bacterium]
MSCQVYGDSHEAVAFGLMQCVLFAAGRGNQEHPFPAGSTLLRGQTSCNERELLSLYARCLRIVKGELPEDVISGGRPMPEGPSLHA